MNTTLAGIDQWIEQAKARLSDGTLWPQDLEKLREVLRGGKFRQRLLYLHASTPHIGSQLVAACVHEPRKEDGAVATLDPMKEELPYKSVHDAICDGWQVIHFPLQKAPFDDREIDILGYEFVLQKLEYCDE